VIYIVEREKILEPLVILSRAMERADTPDLTGENIGVSDTSGKIVQTDLVGRGGLR
jgi:hypothetical protein